MQLNTVVLPAPFGPISAVMSPRRAVNDTSLTAISPPNRMVRCSTVSTGSAGAFTATLSYGLPLHGEADISIPPPLSVTLSHERAGYCLAFFEECGGLARCDQAARPPDHDCHHGKAEHKHAVLLEFAKQLEPTEHGEGGDRDAQLRAHAAENDNGEHQRRLAEGERFRADESLPRREERTGEAAEHRTHRESGELGVGGV